MLATVHTGLGIWVWSWYAFGRTNRLFGYTLEKESTERLFNAILLEPFYDHSYLRITIHALSSL